MHTNMLKKIMAEPLVKAGEKSITRQGALTVKHDSDVDQTEPETLERYVAEITWRIVLHARQGDLISREHALRELYPAMASMLYAEIRAEVMEALAASHRLGLVHEVDQEERDDGLVLHTALRRILDMTQAAPL